MGSITQAIRTKRFHGEITLLQKPEKAEVIVVSLLSSKILLNIARPTKC
jgi:hypothetical protein